MPIVSITKPDLLNDPDPGTVAPPASRIFPVSMFAPNGHQTNRELFRAKAIGLDGSPTPVASFAATSLYLKLNGQWQLAGNPVTDIVQGQLASALFGGSSEATVDGYLRMEGIVAPGANHIVQTLYEADETSFTPRNVAGLQQVSPAQPRSWQTLVQFSTVAAPASITGGASVPVEQFVLLQSSTTNAPNYVYILDDTALAGGYQLAAGESVRWPAKDVAEIFCVGDVAGMALLITRF
jgi:hypothetical protein